MKLDMEVLQKWVGKKEEQIDRVTLAPLTAMAATLDRADTRFNAGDEVPPLWHWLYFLPATRQADLAEDGHPAKGTFLPPIPLPRRMWAGSRITFHHSLRAQQPIKRRSMIKSVESKSGRSGELAFVCVQHEIDNEAGIAVLEEHDIVYRDNPLPSTRNQPLPSGIPAPTESEFTKQFVVDPVFLFRYSALTFNGHRIHYDRRYVTEVEGYPGLIVHGPLLATLMIELLYEHFLTGRLTYFEFRALRPVFDINAFTISGKQIDDTKVDIWVQDHQGFLCMQGHAELTP